MPAHLRGNLSPPCKAGLCRQLHNQTSTQRRELAAGREDAATAGGTNEDIVSDPPIALSLEGSSGLSRHLMGWGWA